MVTNKYINAVIAALTALAVLACGIAVVFSRSYGEAEETQGLTMEYETALFGTEEPIQVNILMDEAQWQEMLDNALSEEYYSCDVVVNGETYKNVGIRPKGNTSLSSIANDPDTERYSLKLEFDHYVEGQTCCGLDKLILNNNYADATNMKEAVVYDMFQYLGADASLYNYAEISVNGNYWGVYLALEAVEDSFMLRNYGTSNGELYKPENLDGGGGQKQGMPEGGAAPENMDRQMPAEGMPDAAGAAGRQGDAENEGFPGRGNFPGGDENGRNGGFSRGGGGSDLNYVDDDPDSYSTIWEGEVTNTGDSDHQKVIKALKNISQGNDLETCMDVDNLLKYMAVHTFSVNLDSLSGNMAHNYYLYESEGRLNIIPWDYNLSFGGMNMGGGGGGPQNMRPQDDGSSAAGTDAPESSEAADAGAAPGAAAGSSVDSATEMINFPIDSPFESTEFFDGLLENEEYLARYHEYLRMLCEEYVNGGRYDELMERFHTQIDGLVETDPNALYDYEEYTEATEMLSQVVKLRAESILGQLDGSIPSTEEGQDAQPEALLDASSVNIEVMGTMGGLMNRENGWNNKN